MASNLSNTVYAARRKELLALINQLRSVGAQNDLDLPRITVIGNQSAGKSSVVEAISGITVPRDAGTCTRCPMECRLLSSTNDWNCRISIRNEFDCDGNRLREVAEKIFIEKITDKSEVELALRKAQFAVLNPEISWTSILAASAEELKTMGNAKYVPFSQNVVCIDLEGPELTDLSFIDLPGLIQNAEPEVVQLVEDMVVSHIRGNCIILVAVPMTDDIENQKALRLASQEDKDGRRTIGVLTKPDMLTTGSTKVARLWLDVLEDRRHPLRHGYYCTRQPDDDERSAGIAQKQAREAEQNFFKTTVPWCQSTSPTRFGTQNLVFTLSRLLVQVINDNLPKIREDTAKQLLDCCKELAHIPPPISDEPATYMLSLVTSFCSEFQTLVRGRADSAELIRLHRQSYGTFKTTIRKTAPRFVPFEANQTVTDFDNCLDDEENDPIAKVSAIAISSMNLTEVRNHVNRCLARELPNNIPYEAKASLILRFQTSWPEAVDDCFRGVETDTLKILIKMIEQYFGRFTLLHSHMKNFVKMLMDEHKERCNVVLKATIETEQMPFTQNGHYLESCQQGWLSKYKAVRSGKVGEGELDPQAKRRKLAASTNGFAGYADKQTTLAFPNAFGNGSMNVPVYTFTGFGSNRARAATTEGRPTTSGKAAATPPSPQADHAAKKTETRAKPSRATTSSFPSPKAASSMAKTVPEPFNQSQQAAQAANDSDSETNSTTELETRNCDTTNEQALQEAISLLVKAGLPVSSLSPMDLLGKLVPPDEFETELRVMADVRGYFQVAYKRMIDNIPRFIDLLFVRELGKTLQPFIISKFGMGTSSANERCASYLGEDPMLVSQRDELLARKKRLENVEKELDEYSLHI
ncbi:P-loop containing nucleoside triphosphate hydrolase protein [Lentinula aff. detonsa]|uniref:P-loop containing nucleoside triphosphate hydrolase protein n=1 Tax=Lentinula aff. detonsa TaxID=2804958 RepID=A0AA38KPT1_9AGAR|nr:P-loop containing nucleoside triphosphate hydrolase protein [Lentinula aff. detonsa]